MALRVCSRALAVIVCLATATVAQAATIAPSLVSRLTTAVDSTSLGVVIVAFTGTAPIGATETSLLQRVGISKGIVLRELGMIAAPATVGQVKALATNAAVRSIWSNDALRYFLNEARVLTGVDRLRDDGTMTTLNGGLPVSGAGDFSVVINDSGIDATHGDLRLGQTVVQNVFAVTDTDTLSGFTPLLTVDNVANTDLNSGHGTHCAGIVGGNGERSAGLYGGVAPGAKLIGVGSGAALFVLNALSGFEWSLVHQAQYQVRVISNSWGSSGAFDPDNPINIASKKHTIATSPSSSRRETRDQARTRSIPMRKRRG